MEQNSLNKRINIYIADNSAEDITKLTNYFSNKQNFNIIGNTGNAEQALEVIKTTQVDVLIMDVVLSGLDGFEFLQIAKQDMGSKMPKVIITSNLTHTGFINKAISLGANYFLIKPFNFETLEERITDLFAIAPTKNHLSKSESKILDEKISNIFLTVGIPAHIKGYQFLREAIKLAIEKPEIVSSITKQLYPSIADIFSTSPSKVERAIRHAIEVAWNRGKIENINNIFGIKVYNQNEKPTNGEFIALVADKMLMEGY